ncbi:MAG: hypothetical protein ABI333_07735 [bacterium]
MFLAPQPRPARVALGLLTTLLLTSLTAPPARAKVELDLSRKRGLMVSGGVGLNGCTGDHCDNLRPLLSVKLHPAFRILPYVAAGLHLSFLSQSPGFPTGGGRAELWQLLLGPEVRGLLPLKKLDLWAAFSLGYHRTRRLVASDGHRIESVTNGFGFGWGLGVDYYLYKNRVAIGGDVWVYKAIPLGLCTRVGVNPQACRTEDVPDGYGATIAVGLTAVWFLSL